MPKKILIVDDEEDILEILKTLLEDDGYSIILAQDGEEGVKKAVSEKPDIIIIDIMMPKLDGFEAVSQLRSNADTFHIPVIMLTSKDQKIDREKGLSLGIAAYIVKLFDLEELRAKVKEILDSVPR